MSLQKISVIIPFYNAQRYIRSCFQLLEAQTYQNMEVILVNDGSTDRTDEMIRRYLETTPLSVIYLSQKNRGQAYSRNRGMVYASGKYIAFVDSDDRIEADYLERLCGTAEAYNADVVNCGYRTVREDGRIISEVSVSPFSEVSDDGRAGVFAVWAKLFRREFIQKYGIIFPEGKLYEDVPFSLEAKFRAGCVKSISYIGYSYVRRPGSTMMSGIVKSGKFPYGHLEKAVADMVRTGGVRISLLEFELLYFFTGFLFLYCRKMPAKELFCFCTYAKKLLQTYFPDYKKEAYRRLCSYRDLPFCYRAAVRCFVSAMRTNTLKPFAWALTRIG